MIPFITYDEGTSPGCTLAVITTVGFHKTCRFIRAFSSLLSLAVMVKHSIGLCSMLNPITSLLK